MASLGLGVSFHPDGRRALQTAARAARKRAGAEPTGLICLFVSAAHDAAPIAGHLRSLFGDTPVLGCTVERLLVEPDDVHNPHALAVVAISGVRAEVGDLAADGMAVSFHAQPEHLERTDGATFAASGVRPLVFTGDQAFQGQVEARLPGRCALSVVADSLAAVGPVMRVTDSDGCVIRALDGRPAAQVVSTYVGTQAMRGARLPVVLGLGQPVARVAGLRPREGALQCDVPVRCGGAVRLLLADRETMLEHGRRVAAAVETSIGQQPALLVLCAEGTVGPGEEDDRWDRLRMIAEAAGDVPLLGIRGGDPRLSVTVLQ